MNGLRKAAFALLPDIPTYNFARRLAVELHEAYGTGWQAGMLPPHVSLKQPFDVADWDAVETYFDTFAASLPPVEITLTRPYVWEAAPMFGLDVAATDALRQTHERLNAELAARFGDTAAPFDGPEYHFHLTVAIGGASVETYRQMGRDFADVRYDRVFTARQLAMFVYTQDSDGQQHYMTYKILPTCS